MRNTPVNLLVVDDEPALRKVLRRSLGPVGYAVEEASSGEEALGTLEQRPSDLVLLDIGMPGIGGIETCRRIRELAPGIGIVMVSVCGREDDKVHALEAGADDYVTKPFRFRELLARLRSVLRRALQQAHLLELVQHRIAVVRRQVRPGRRQDSRSD